MAHLSKTDCYDLVGVLCTAQYTGIMTSLDVQTDKCGKRVCLERGPDLFEGIH